MLPARLALDFVAAPAARRAGRVLLLAGVAAAAAGALQLAPAWREREQQRDELLRVATSVRPHAAAAGAPLRGLRSAQDVAAELTAPWGILLAALEGVPTRDIALLAVEPIAGRQSLQITADARNADAMLDLLAALQKQPPLADVVLVSHQIQAQQPGTPMRFRIQARWTGGNAPGARQAAR